MRSSLSDRTFSSPEIAQIIGHTLNKTLAYVRRGYIKPSVQDADGHGTRRIWSYSDVVRMAIIRHLEDLGLSVSVLRVLGNAIRESWLDPETHWTVYIDNQVPESALAVLAEDEPVSFPVSEEVNLCVIRSHVSIEHGDELPPLIAVSMKYFHRFVENRIENI